MFRQLVEIMLILKHRRQPGSGRRCSSIFTHWFELWNL